MLYDFYSEIRFCSHRDIKTVLLFMYSSIIMQFKMSGAIDVNSQFIHTDTQQSSPSAAWGRHGPYALILLSFKGEFHHNFCC